MARWHSLELFSELDRATLSLPEGDFSSWQDFLWKDLCAEFDARNLYHEVQRRKSRYSADFLNYVENWYQDELNHALGFARIYELLFGESISSLWRRLGRRPSNFEGIQSYLDDEFKLLCLLAYDELATTHTYHKDIDFYRSLGSASLNTWIERLKQDEARHYAGAMKLLRKHHSHRFLSADAVMTDILRIDLNQTEYQATFVLDHSSDCSHFQLDEDELTSKCARFIARRLEKLAVRKSETALLQEEVC